MVSEWSDKYVKNTQADILISSWQNKNLYTAKDQITITTINVKEKKNLSHFKSLKLH